MGAARISFDNDTIGIGGCRIIARFFNQLGRPKDCSGRQRILWVLPPKVIVGLDRPADVPLVLRLLCDREKLLRVAANLLFARGNIFHFFPGTKDDGRLSRAGQEQSAKQKNKQSNSHGTSQGSCLCGSVKGTVAQKEPAPLRPIRGQLWLLFPGCPAHMMSWIES